MTDRARQPAHADEGATPGDGSTLPTPSAEWSRWLGPPSQADPAPAWLWLLVLLGAVFLIGFAASGLGAAMLGGFHTWIAVAGGAAAVVAAYRPTAAAIPRGGRAGDRVAIAAVVGALLFSLWSGTHQSQTVVIFTDPGSYLTTARWLDRTGRLYVETNDYAIGSEVELDPTGPAVYWDADQTRLEFQFSHGAAVVYAGAFEVGGTRALFGAPSVVGALALMAVYLVLTCVAPHRLVALAGTTALAASVPFLYVTRSTYSEVFVLALLSCGLALLMQPGRVRPEQLGLAALFVGSTVLFRIDAQLYVVGLLLVGALLVINGDRPRQVLAGLAWLIPPLVLGWLDLMVFATGYADALASEVRKMWVATVLALAILAALMVPQIRRRSAEWSSRARTVAVPVGACVGLLGLFALVVRPYVQVARAGWEEGSPFDAAVERLQQAAGLEPDGLRSYGEMTLRMLGWYLGVPLVLMAIAGLAALAVWAIRGPDSMWARLATMVAVGVPLYLWSPNITPSQPWMTRRFVPFVIPMLVVAALIGLSAVRPRRPAAARIVLVAGSLLMVVPVVVTTWPVRDQAEQRGFVHGVNQICEVTDGADLLQVDFTPIYVMPSRAWCGVVAASIDPDEGAAIAATIAESQVQCRPLVLITSTADLLTPFSAQLGDVTQFTYRNPDAVEITIDEPPDEYRVERLDFTMARVRSGPSCALPTG